MAQVPSHQLGWITWSHAPPGPFPAMAGFLLSCNGFQTAFLCLTYVFIWKIICFLYIIFKDFCKLMPHWGIKSTECHSGTEMPPVLSPFFLSTSTGSGFQDGLQMNIFCTKTFAVAVNEERPSKPSDSQQGCFKLLNYIKSLHAPTFTLQPPLKA